MNRLLREASALPQLVKDDERVGAVVNQQPFGGSHASGTNDKAGSMLNPQRWVTPESSRRRSSPPPPWATATRRPSKS